MLADEINRTPPKTQAALLEAMQERQVTVGRVRHTLADPFFVLATQNPIEQEGTYPLPEAQQDRFMFKVFVKYPSFNEEKFKSPGGRPALATDDSPVLSGDRDHRLQRIVRKVPVSDHVVEVAVGLRAGEAAAFAGRQPAPLAGPIDARPATVCIAGLPRRRRCGAPPRAPRAAGATGGRVRPPGHRFHCRAPRRADR